MKPHHSHIVPLIPKEHSLNEQVQALRELLQKLVHQSNKNHERKMALPVKHGHRLIFISEIMYCQASNNYTEVYICDGSKHIISKTLKYVEQLIQSDVMIRCHQSYLANRHFISHILLKGFSKIKLKDGTLIPVSKRRRIEVSQLLLQHIKQV